MLGWSYTDRCNPWQKNSLRELMLCVTAVSVPRLTKIQTNIAIWVYSAFWEKSHGEQKTRQSRRAKGEWPLPCLAVTPRRRKQLKRKVRIGVGYRREALYRWTPLFMSLLLHLALSVIFFVFVFCVCFILFCNCVIPLGFLPWEIRVAFPGESQLQQSCTTQPTVHTGCFSVSIIHGTLTWTKGCLMFAQMLAQVLAHGGVRTP